MEHQEIKNVFRERFDKLRADRSNTEFAAFLGISRQTVGFYLNDGRMPDAVTLAKIAVRCGVSTDYLLGLTDEATPNVDERAASEFSGLSVKALGELRELFTKPDKDGVYAAGFVDSQPDCPRKFLDDVLYDGDLFLAAVEFCSAINRYTNSVAPDCTAKTYGGGDNGEDVVISAREYALLSKERARAFLSGFLDRRWQRLCIKAGVNPHEIYDYSNIRKQIMDNAKNESARKQSNSMSSEGEGFNAVDEA